MGKDNPHNHYGFMAISIAILNLVISVQTSEICMFSKQN